MGSRILLISSVVFLLVLAGCRESASPTPTSAASQTVTVELVTMEPSAPIIGAAVLNFRVLDAGQAVMGAEVSVRGDMTHAGMAPVEAVGETDMDGIARIPFEWTMGGDWSLTVTATLPEGSTVEVVVDLAVASS